jgi:hypothetical protein
LRESLRDSPKQENSEVVLCALKIFAQTVAGKSAAQGADQTPALQGRILPGKASAGSESGILTRKFDLGGAPDVHGVWAQPGNRLSARDTRSDVICTNCQCKSTH